VNCISSRTPVTVTVDGNDPVCNPDSTCDQPSGVSVGVNLNTATFSWVLEPNAILTQIQYRISPVLGGGGNGTSIAGAGITTKTVSGLSCDRTYQSRMRFNCGGGLLSPWKFKSFIVPACGRFGEENDTFGIVDVHPNPASDFVNITYQSNSGDAVRIEIIDVLGKMVHSQDFATSSGISEIQIDMSDFSQGIYFVKMDDGAQTVTRKIMKQ
jgi:hypothetical protein